MALVDEDLAELHRILAAYTNPQCHFGTLPGWDHQEEIKAILKAIEQKKITKAVQDWLDENQDPP